MEEIFLTLQMRKNIEIIRILKDQEKTYSNGCDYLLKGLLEEKNRKKAFHFRTAKFYLTLSVYLGKQNAENMLAAFFGIPNKEVRNNAIRCLNTYIWYKTSKCLVPEGISIRDEAQDI